MKAVKGLKTVNNNANSPLLPKDDAHWQRLIARVQAMTLMDDIFFNCFMEDDTAAMQYSCCLEAYGQTDDRRARQSYI